MAKKKTSGFEGLSFILEAFSVFFLWGWQIHQRICDKFSTSRLLKDSNFLFEEKEAEQEQEDFFHADSSLMAPFCWFLFAAAEIPNDFSLPHF